MDTDEGGAQVSWAAGHDGVQHLLRARLAVARLGERNLLGWWLTDDVLGEDGAYVASRSLPKTHPAGRARIATAVARDACQRRFPRDDAQHLLSLPASAEAAVEACIAAHLGAHEWWQEMLAPMEALTGSPEDLGAWLVDLGATSQAAVRQARELPLGPDGRSLHLPSCASWQEQAELMAAGFARGTSGELVVPYVLHEECPGHG